MVVVGQVRLDARHEQRCAVIMLVHLQGLLVNTPLLGRHVATELQQPLLFPLPIEIGAVLVATKELRLFLGRQEMSIAHLVILRGLPVIVSFQQLHLPHMLSFMHLTHLGHLSLLTEIHHLAVSCILTPVLLMLVTLVGAVQ